MTERDLREELSASSEESSALRAKMDALQERIAEATSAFEAMGSAERRLSEIADAFGGEPDAPAAG